MARKDIIMLSQRELKKLHMIKKVLEGVVKQIEAAEMLSLSDRQIRSPFFVFTKKTGGQGGS